VTRAAIAGPSALPVADPVGGGFVWVDAQPAGNNASAATRIKTR